MGFLGGWVGGGIQFWQIKVFSGKLFELVQIILFVLRVLNMWVILTAMCIKFM